VKYRAPVTHRPARRAVALMVRSPLVATSFHKFRSSKSDEGVVSRSTASTVSPSAAGPRSKVVDSRRTLAAQ
jgi:hypothetical protein